MEHAAAIHEGDWSSEETEFMAQLLGNCSLPNEVLSSFVSPAYFAVADEAETAMYSSDSFSGGSSIVFPFSSQESYYSTLSHHVSVTDNNDLMTMDYCTVEGRNGDFLNQDVSNDSMESNNDARQEKEMEFVAGLAVSVPPLVPREDRIISPSDSKKRSRVPCDAPRSSKKIKSRKFSKFDDRQSSSSCCSEDESNPEHEMNRTASCSSSKGCPDLNSNGRTRASRGSATDPQSLYARKRRERINERLKVLQTLVPNGTKVDISTMLEEAVEYVKFLQLQIKLLSSDDHWMFAPIAYNGMDIGLMATPKSQS